MWRSTTLVAVLSFAACSEIPPSGPSVMALPMSEKSFESFQLDDATCRGYAAQVAGPVATSDDTFLGTALFATALGAGAVAALGSAGGAAGAGAAIGGTTGLIAGTAIGANNAPAISGNAKRATTPPIRSACIPKGIPCKRHLDMRTAMDPTMTSRMITGIHTPSDPWCSVLGSAGFIIFVTNITRFTTAECITIEAPMPSARAEGPIRSVSAR
jgi:hypothetical protein